MTNDQLKQLNKAFGNRNVHPTKQEVNDALSKMDSRAMRRTEEHLGLDHDGYWLSTNAPEQVRKDIAYYAKVARR